MVLLRNLLHLGLNGLVAAHGLGSDGTNLTPRTPATADLLVGEAALFNARSLPGMGTDIGQLKHVLRRARSVVEDQAGMVQVPQKELHEVLGKIKSLEDQVNGMLSLEGESSASPTSKPDANDDDCAAERLLLHLGPRSLTDGSTQVSDHPFFKRTNCDMDSLVAGHALSHNAVMKKPLVKSDAGGGSAGITSHDSTRTTAIDASATVSDATTSMGSSLASAMAKYKAALKQEVASMESEVASAPAPTTAKSLDAAPSTDAALSVSSQMFQTMVFTSTTTIRRTRTVTLTQTNTPPLAQATASTEAGKTMQEEGDNVGGTEPVDTTEAEDDEGKGKEPVRFGNGKVAVNAQKFSNSSAVVASSAKEVASAEVASAEVTSAEVTGPEFTNAVATSVEAPAAADTPVDEAPTQISTSPTGDLLEGPPEVTPFMGQKPDEPKMMDQSTTVSQPMMTDQPQESSLLAMAEQPKLANQLFKGGFANMTALATQPSGFVTISRPDRTGSTKPM